MKIKISQKIELSILLYISIIIVIINDFIFSDVTEIICYGDQIGQILSTLSIAYISSYIFYWVVVIAKEKRDKKNINLTLYDLTVCLINSGYSVYNEIINASGESSNNFDKKNISLEEFQRLCSKANPNEIPSGRRLMNLDRSWEATYGQFIYQDAYVNVDFYKNKILDYMIYLDSDFVKLINQIQYSKFTMIAKIFSYKLENKDFSIFSEDMFNFLVCIRALEKYNEKFHKNYEV